MYKLFGYWCHRANITGSDIPSIHPLSVTDSQRTRSSECFQHLLMTGKAFGHKNSVLLQIFSHASPILMSTPVWEHDGMVIIVLKKTWNVLVCPRRCTNRDGESRGQWLKPGLHSNAIACVAWVNENRKKCKRLHWQAANHGCHCFNRAFLMAGACVCCVKI